MTDQGTLRLERAYRSLQLPVRTVDETGVFSSLTDFAFRDDMSPDDLAITIEHDREKFDQGKGASKTLRTAVELALAESSAGPSLISAKEYFLLFARLRVGSKDLHGLDESTVRRLLSRAPLIRHLLVEERFSCTQVARVISAAEPTLDVPYSAIGLVAATLGCQPSLDGNSAGSSLWSEDYSLSRILFPDSSAFEACSVANDELRALLPEIDLEELLSDVLGGEAVGASPNWPYIQMLHWCMVPIEFYDHPPSFLYEFAPRGQIAMSLFGRYNVPTGNPILNNAKATEALTTKWARNRGGSDAQALVQILAALESVPYPSRVQIARVLRAWIERILELLTTVPKKLEFHCVSDSLRIFAEAVSGCETRTQGVIEQRVVDALGLRLYSGAEWRPSGIGDGVNVTNFSRKKLGDIEFMNLDARLAVAIEAHGGVLTPTYVESHRQSLRRVLRHRLEESLSKLDRPENWRVDVIFVAHQIAPSLAEAVEVVEGANVRYVYKTYSEFAAESLASSNNGNSALLCQEHVIDALNRDSVRDEVRERFVQITGQGNIVLA